MYKYKLRIWGYKHVHSQMYKHVHLGVVQLVCTTPKCTTVFHCELRIAPYLWIENWEKWGMIIENNAIRPSCFRPNCSRSNCCNLIVRICRRPLFEISEFSLLSGSHLFVHLSLPFFLSLFFLSHTNAQTHQLIRTILHTILCNWVHY